MSTKTDSDIIKIILDNQEGILSCEIGSLLHLLGKLHGDFLEDPENANVEKIDHIKKTASISIYVLTGSPPRLSNKSSVRKYIIKENTLLSICHGKSGAEEKGGLVDPKNDKAEHLITPFGKQLHSFKYNDLRNLGLSENDTQKLDDILFVKLSNTSAKNVREYLYNTEKPFGKMLRIAPGETRKPGNDLSVWDQSYATASLYKPAIIMALCNRNIPNKQIGWRLLRIHIGTKAFLGRSKRLQDLLARRELLDNLMKRIREIIEVEIPVGNLVLKTDQEMYFTFPAINPKPAKKIMDEVGDRLIKQTEQTEDKLQLSLGYELGLSIHCTKSSRLASECLSGKDIFDDQIKPVRPISKMPESKGTKDTCPVCGVRSLAKREDESCEVCKNRTKGRLKKWFENRKNDTIWIGELADHNKKVALLTFSLNLERWLSGEWFSTICSNREIKDKPLFEQCEWLRQNWDSAKDSSAELLQAMLPTVRGIQEDNIEIYLQNSSKWFGKTWDCTGDRLTASELATRVGTLNPSTGRLLRAIKEAENFSEKFVEILRSRLGSKRLIISLDGPELVPWRTYEMKIKPASNNENLKSVQVIAISGNTIVTIESMALFDENARDGSDVLEKNIREADLLELETEEEQIREPNPIKLKVKDLSHEEYRGLTIIGETPFLFQVMVPADRVAEITKELIESHYREFFGLVEGKLPLNVSIAVAKRKFPLYALMEAGERMICKEFSTKGRMMKPWWEYPGNKESFKEMSEYFKYYPTKEPREDLRIFEYKDLKEISYDKEFWLTPGFFDFENLSSTSDLNRISYMKKDDDHSIPQRDSAMYGWFPSRPFFTHRFIDMEELWLQIKDKGKTKLHNVEDILLGKLLDWGITDVNNYKNKDATFFRFADVTLMNYLEIGLNDIQGDENGQKIGLLLDTLQFHMHVLGMMGVIDEKN